MRIFNGCGSMPIHASMLSWVSAIVGSCMVAMTSTLSNLSLSLSLSLFVFLFLSSSHLFIDTTLTHTPKYNKGLLPGIFKRLNSHQIPVWGSIITGICAATIAFLFDLGSLTDMISIGTLMAFTIVCASVLVLRYQTRAQPYKIPAILIIFVLGCFFTAFLYKYDFPYWSLAVSTVPLLLSFLYILTQKTISVPETFR